MKYFAAIFFIKSVPVTPLTPAPAAPGPQHLSSTVTSLKVLNYHSLVGAGVADVPGDTNGSPSCHWIMIESPEVHLMLAFETEQDKQGWLVKLKEAMPDVLKSFRSSSTRMLRTRTTSMDRSSERHRAKRSDTFSGVPTEEPKQRSHHQDKAHKKHH